jgi:hypothetical protein
MQCVHAGMSAAHPLTAVLAQRVASHALPASGEPPASIAPGAGLRPEPQCGKWIDVTGTYSQ